MSATSKKFSVELSAKSIRFVLRAIEFQMRDYEARLSRGQLSEDDEADLRNDLRLFEIIHDNLVEALPAWPSE